MVGEVVLLPTVTLICGCWILLLNQRNNIEYFNTFDAQIEIHLASCAFNVDGKRRADKNLFNANLNKLAWICQAIYWCVIGVEYHWLLISEAAKTV